MPLSSEDNLRLNVLMAQPVKAIRIDEGKMIVHALTEKGHAKIHLCPNMGNDAYLKLVRDFLSNKVLGISGGFPVYITHWNRLGEARGDNLEKLLLLAEEAAVVAVVNARALTPELAERAWWAYQSADYARSMLTNKDVVGSKIGKELAAFLLEFLPFEEKPADMLASARLVLQDQLISEEDKLKLWQKAKTKNTLYLGFLDTTPNQLPEQQSAHADEQQIAAVLSDIRQHNQLADNLCLLLSSQGQSFLHTAQQAFRRPPNQVVYAALIESIRRYIINPRAEERETLYEYSLGLRTNAEVETDIHKIVATTEQLLADRNARDEKQQQLLRDYEQIVERQADLSQFLKAILLLSQFSQAVTFPVFSKSNAEGTLMRKKLKPVTDMITQQLQILQHGRISPN